MMRLTLKIEELAMTAVAIFSLTQNNFGIPPWLWFILFFAPDIGMPGYLINNRVGLITYNIFHHKGIAIAVSMLGFFISNDMMIAAGILLFARSSFDRIRGYGLKYADSFKNTHLEKGKQYDCNQNKLYRKYYCSGLRQHSVVCQSYGNIFCDLGNTTSLIIPWKSPLIFVNY